MLAGAHVAHGSSAAQERSLLEREPELAEAVVDLGAVNGGEREWLLSNAAAVVYPSIVEGFGLLPFEAATAGTACLFAPQSALGELLPPETAAVHAWDVAASASAAVPLLVDGEPRARHIGAIRDAALRYTWATCGALTLQAYERALTVRARASARAAWEAEEREREVVRLDQAIKDKDVEMRDFRDSLGSDGLALVGEHGVLSREDQRALLALAARGPLRRGLFAGLRSGYRILHRDHGSLTRAPRTNEALCAGPRQAADWTARRTRRRHQPPYREVNQNVQDTSGRLDDLEHVVGANVSTVVESSSYVGIELRRLNDELGTLRDDVDEHLARLWTVRTRNALAARPALR